MHFVGNLIRNICANVFDDDFITMTSFVNRTQRNNVLFSAPVVRHNSQVTNNAGVRKMNKLNRLISPLLNFKHYCFILQHIVRVCSNICPIYQPASWCL